MSTITVPNRFRGPPNSGNGGYCGGAFAALLDVKGPVEVTLRAPIPLDEPMTVRSGEGVSVHHGDTLIAEVRAAALDLDVPAPPALDAIRAAAPDSYSLHGRNTLVSGRGFHPICFCCGVEHDDGLNVFAAPVDGTDQVAAVWLTKAEWGKDGILPSSFVWTALDCPGQFAYLAGGIRTGMLGRITAEVYEPVKAGEEYLVTGWRIEVEGKKHFAGTALTTLAGKVLAAAKTVWIGRRE